MLSRVWVAVLWKLQCLVSFRHQPSEKLGLREKSGKRCKPLLDCFLLLGRSQLRRSEVRVATPTDRHPKCTEADANDGCDQSDAHTSVEAPKQLCLPLGVRHP